MYNCTENIPIGGENPFTKRELEILTLISLYKDSEEIAKDLSISVNTVHTHRRRIIAKSHEFIPAPDTKDIVIWALRRGLID
ncbi:MAG: helix-turn-helix transcriptional regulator [Bacteroidota bacterium]